MAYFPMMTDLGGKSVLVIGGGDEGAKKIHILHSFGARITLIAINACEEAVAECDEYIEGPFSEEQINRKDFALVVASTDDRPLNRRISDLARERKIPVNIVDDTELCTFIFPAIYREGDVVCAVSSGGKSPYITQYIRDHIRDILPDDIGAINDKMGRLRQEAKERFPDASKRRRFLKEKLSEMIGKNLLTDKVE